MDEIDLICFYLSIQINQSFNSLQLSEASVKNYSVLSAHSFLRYDKVHWPVIFYMTFLIKQNYADKFYTAEVSVSQAWL